MAFGVSALVELFQMTGIPDDLADHSPLARLVLGTTFNAPDLLWYAVGAALAGLLDAASRPGRGPRTRLQV